MVHVVASLDAQMVGGHALRQTQDRARSKRRNCDSDTDPILRHGHLTVKINPYVARYED